MKLHGLIIDPQEDFCDPRDGALYVGGAEKDMARLARLIERIGPRIDALHVTLDSHHTLDIAHPGWWIDEDGAHPDPFTLIGFSDIAPGRWGTTNPAARERSRAYVAALEAGGRYPLCIWPYHCRIGSAGHAVYAPLFDTLTAWELPGRTVDYIHKGANPWTEHYSALRAEVPDPDDPGTWLNQDLVDRLHAADTVFVAGEAGSHCVANTVRDLADALGDDALLRKFVLLTDAISPVAGFESLQASFVADLTRRGLQLSTTEEFLR